jgi:hypothetical protein
LKGSTKAAILQMCAGKPAVADKDTGKLLLLEPLIYFLVKLAAAISRHNARLTYYFCKNL